MLDGRCGGEQGTEWVRSAGGRSKSSECWAGLKCLRLAVPPCVCQRFGSFMAPTIVVLSSLTLPLGSESAPFYSAVLEHRSS